MTRMPVIAYLNDNFSKPVPFCPDVVVSIDDVSDIKIEMLDCHKSQFYEWLPYNDGNSESIPEVKKDRLQWLEKQWKSVLYGISDKFRSQLIKRYGEEIGHTIKVAEAFEISEYGSSLEDKEWEKLFPF